MQKRILFGLLLCTILSSVVHAQITWETTPDGATDVMITERGILIHSARLVFEISYVAAMFQHRGSNASNCLSQNIAPHLLKFAQTSIQYWCEGKLGPLIAFTTDENGDEKKTIGWGMISDLSDEPGIGYITIFYEPDSKKDDDTLFLALLVHEFAPAIAQRHQYLFNGKPLQTIRVSGSKDLEYTMVDGKAIRSE